MSAEVTRHESTLGEPYPPRRVVSLRCCTFATDWHPVSDEALALNAMSEHLIAEHPAEYGRCATCGRFTDHVRMVAGPLGTAWLCEVHSPTMSEVLEESVPA